jgi:signal transduction histidine kinase
MSISYKIITETHGGQLSWRSVEGESTQFAIDIPVKLEHAKS